MPQDDNIGINNKAYIPLQRETTLVRSSYWVLPPMRRVRFADINMLVSEKPHGPGANPHTPNVNLWAPKASPNASSGI